MERRLQFIYGGAAALLIVTALTVGCHEAPRGASYEQPQYQAPVAAQPAGAAPVVVQQADNGPGWGGALAAGAIGYMAGQHSANQQQVQVAPQRQIIRERTTIIRERAPAPVQQTAAAPIPQPPKPAPAPVTTSPSTFKAPTPTTNTGSFSSRTTGYSSTTTSFSKPSISVGGRR